jgi:NDP-sugar pyrophosphorylase family protein
MRAMILAAGFGTRLGTLSDERPKPMLPVCDIPLLRFGLALLRGHGFSDVAVNLHHRGQIIRDELRDEVRYSEEDTLLGTGGGLVKIGDWLTDGGRASFLVVNGKVVIDVDLAELVRRHEASGAVATLVVREVPDAKKWGAIDLDENDRVTGILGQGRPGARACMFTGVHVVSPRALQRLPSSGESDSVRQSYIPALLDGEPIAALRYGGYFHEHSTPARYLDGNWNLLRGRARLRHPPGPLDGVDATARTDGATLKGPLRVGAGAIVEAGAQLDGDVVVGHGATVRSGARLQRVVIWPGAVVDGGELRDAIVTPRGVQPVAPDAP